MQLEVEPLPSVAYFQSAGGHNIDWDAFDIAVDTLDERDLRRALKFEARMRADGTTRVNEAIRYA